MCSSRFEAFISHQDGTVVVNIRGDVDMAVVDALWAVVHQAVTASPHVVFDMADVTFLDSSGLRVLAATRLDVGADGSVTLRNPSPSVVRVIQLAGLDSTLTVETDGGGEAPAASA